MVDAVGVKVGDREARDIVDVFATSQRELNRLMWHDPMLAPDTSKFTDEQLKKYYAANKDVFDRVEVRVSHIVVRVGPAAPVARAGG